MIVKNERIHCKEITEFEQIVLLADANTVIFISAQGKDSENSWADSWQSR